MKPTRIAFISLAASVAFMAAPALAGESVSGSTGNGEMPRAAPTGPQLSDRAVPIESPKIDEDAASRGLELDPAKVEQGYGVIRRSSNGEVKRMPASEEIKKMIEDSGARGVDPAIDKSEASRQVFGDDDRVQITDSSDFPFRTIGLLQSETPKGLGTCSATLIGPRTVVTAAHCLYDNDEGWRENFLFAPGLLAMDNAPFGVYEYQDAYIFQGFVDNYQGFYGSVVPWDLGVVILKQPIGDQLGWMGFAYDDELGDFVANVIGYPGDKDPGTMWHVSCDVSSQAMNDTNFAYLCDTYPGSSGSSVYMYTEDKTRTIYGINVAENPDFNLAVRINPVYFAWLKNLIQ